MQSVILGKKSIKIEMLPEPYCGWEQLTTNKNYLSVYNQGQRFARLNGNVVLAVLDYFAGDQSDAALVQISQTSYAVETNIHGGTLIANMNINGRIRASLVREDGTFTALPNLLEEDSFDVTCLILGFFPILRMRFEEVEEIFEHLEESYQRGENFCQQDLYKLSDAVYRIFTEKRVETDDKNGCIEMLTEASLKQGGLCYNQVICGCPVYLSENQDLSNRRRQLTVGEAKAEFAEFASHFSWTDQEEELIPDFEDSFEVPEEALRMARRYVASGEERRPMVNFMWRGITAYGKSTGVEIMACVLHMPLLRMTCHTNMETQDFLSDFVPNTSYGEQGDVPRFKHVESNFVRALAKGYIVEVQEISRIKDSGVLVGLNEYDRAGAIIPLVDGSFTRRHKDALVVYTDNVGYNSCRPLDPSVIRRMAFIIDSYDLPKEKAIARLELNTQVHNAKILEKCYTVWDRIRSFCHDKGITDGSISQSELEMWVLAVKLDGYTNYRQNCIECVVAKATNDIEEQEEIIESVVDLYL